MPILRTFSSAASRPFFTPPITGVNGSNYWEKVATFPSPISGWNFLWVGNENRILYAEAIGDLQNRSWQWTLNNGVYSDTVNIWVSQINSSGSNGVNLIWNSTSKLLQFLTLENGQWVLDAQESFTGDTIVKPSYGIAENSNTVFINYDKNPISGVGDGELRVYKKINLNWVEIVRDDFPPQDQTTISGDGNTVAFRSGSGGFAWSIYKWKGTTTTQTLAGDWNLIGSFNFGYGIDAIFLNDDGTRVFTVDAVVTSQNGNVFNYNVTYRAYEFDGTNWAQMGSSITVFATDYLSGTPIPRGRIINKAGDIIYIRSDQSSTLRSISVYKWDGTSWNLMGSPIQGNNLGSAIFVNEAGNKLTIAKDKNYAPLEQYLYIP